MASSPRKMIGQAIAIALIVVVLAAVLFPVFAQSKNGKSRNCIGPLRMSQAALSMYAGDSNGHLPRADAWVDVTYPYTKAMKPYHCPGVRDGYGLALFTGAAEAKLDSSGTILVFDSTEVRRNATASLETLPQPGRHSGKDCYVTMSGAARCKAPGQIRSPALP